MRVWHYPAFGDYQSWTAMVSPGRPRDDARPMVRQITWRRIDDRRRFIDPLEGLKRGFYTRPSLEVVDAYMALADWRVLMSGVRDVDVPLFERDDRVILDGDWFGVIGYGPVCPCKEWEGKGPEGWKAFTRWIADIRGFLKGCIEAAGKPDDYEHIWRDE